jgi:hypothetical protein
VSEINTIKYRKNENSSLLFNIKKIWSFVGFEELVWICGLFYLIFINSPETSHFTICPIANLGFDFCPGCGLGNSISYLFRGDLEASFNSHPFGIFAFLIVIIRIISLIKNNRRRLCQMSYN